MKKKTQILLREILDRLVSGLSLKVNHSILIAAFGREDTIKEAEKFAHVNECAFRYEPGKHPGDGVGIFGRAYSKKEDE